MTSRGRNHTGCRRRRQRTNASHAGVPRAIPPAAASSDTDEGREEGGGQRENIERILRGNCLTKGHSRIQGVRQGCIVQQSTSSSHPSGG